ncbi:MAG TPA: histidine phosphatase family protein [Rhodospirillales bacterium]|nr:histidine phosphatase family protein [Rhodospirillales bacterium]HJO68853.1 histidine phosphatase family protein [Rhodospirillales bacterium]
MTPFALIRHGPTEWNAARRLQGRADTALSAAGREVVRAWAVPPPFGRYRWIASPLARCRETAQALIGAAPAHDDRLAEMDWGEWQGRTLADLRAELGAAMVDVEACGLDFRAPGGESPREVFYRVRPLLAEIAGDGTPTVAVTHRGVIRVIYAVASGWDMTGKPPAKMRDGCLQVFALDADGSPRLGRLNVALER